MTFLRNLALALLIAVAGTTAAHAQVVGDWEIKQDHDNCSALTTYDAGTVAYLGHFPSRGVLSVVIIDSNIFGDAEDNTSFDGHLMFVNNPEEAKLETRWSGLAASGTVLESGKHGIIIEGPTEPMLDTFAKNGFFAVTRGNDVLVSLKMNRGPEVVAALRACIAKL